MEVQSPQRLLIKKIYIKKTNPWTLNLCIFHFPSVWRVSFNLFLVMNLQNKEGENMQCEAIFFLLRPPRSKKGWWEVTDCVGVGWAGQGGWLGSLGAHQLLAQTQSHSHASKTKTKENLDHTNYWQRVTHQLTYTQQIQPHSLCIFWQKVADPLFVFLVQSSWSSSLALVQLHVEGQLLTESWERDDRNSFGWGQSCHHKTNSCYNMIIIMLLLLKIQNLIPVFLNSSTHGFFSLFVYYRCNQIIMFWWTQQKKLSNTSFTVVCIVIP